MSEQSGEKTEEPTEKKLEDGRKKGQVAQSQDVHKLFITAVGFEIIIALHNSYIEKIIYVFHLAFNSSNEDFFVAINNLFFESSKLYFFVIIPFFFAVIISRIAASFVQFGFLFAPEALKMDLNHISPVKNSKNLINKKKIVEFIGNIVKAILLATIVLTLIKIFINEILLLSFSNLFISIDFSIILFSYVLRISLFVFLIISVIDFILQKKIFIKSMMMTKDEVFREYKQQEGDPEVKSERKFFGRQLIEDGGEIQKKVKDSDAIVVNPTHFAIALKYKPGETPLPVIQSKGVDDRAKEIIAYAEKYNIPVVRYVILARTLFRVGREGKFIPRSTLKPMAAVFRAIRQIEASQKEGAPNVITEIRDDNYF